MTIAEIAAQMGVTPETLVQEVCGTGNGKGNCVCRVWRVYDNPCNRFNDFWFYPR